MDLGLVWSFLCLLSLVENYDIYEVVETLVDLSDIKQNVCNVIKQLKDGKMKTKQINLSHWFIQRQMWQ